MSRAKMKAAKLPRGIMRLMLLLPLLAGCAGPTAAPSPSPTPPEADVPPAPTEGALLLMPGDEIGGMRLEVGPSWTPHLMEYCPPAFSDQPGLETVECRMPLLPEFEIGAGWAAGPHHPVVTSAHAQIAYQGQTPAAPQAAARAP